VVLGSAARGSGNVMELKQASQRKALLQLCVLSLHLLK
jgi:hypothetical protein